MKRFFIALSALCLSTQFAFAVLSLDGNGNSSATGATCASVTSLVTANANDIIVVVAAANRTNASGAPAFVTGVAGNSLTYNKYNAFSYHSGGLGTDWIDIEIWWALAASAGTYTPTVTFSPASDNCAYIDFGVTGANTSTPFDTNAGNSGACTAGTAAGFCGITAAAGAPSLSGVSTNCNNTMVIQASANWNNSTTPAGQTAGTIGGVTATLVGTRQASTGSDNGQLSVQELIVAAPQTSITATFPTSWPQGNITIVQAIQAAGTSCSGATALAPQRTLTGVGK